MPEASNPEFWICRKFDWVITSWVWNNWELRDDSRVLVTLKTRKKFGTLFEGSFDSTQITLRYDRKKDLTTIEDSKHMDIAHIEKASKLDPIFHWKGTEFLMKYESNKGFVIYHENKLVAGTVFFRGSTPVYAWFTLYHHENGYPPPGLIAIVGHYFAINRAMGYP
ncbi:MAG: hypothetical protein LUO79_06425 [Methanomassiliicoccales archaeon]|nr:hypothetical protein [Methanomassiliicoccales archaeon]